MRDKVQGNTDIFIYWYIPRLVIEWLKNYIIVFIFYFSIFVIISIFNKLPHLKIYIIHWFITNS